ncbi:MAG TPA: HlyD family efflux transporter periplasmic adaptor subunit [Burkholderiales bacterium]|nr:HlyD family efflux transporter periplasmic adaptor subunit [Burkholderiales bacterium]
MSAAQPGGGAGTARFDVAGTARAELDHTWRRFGGADNPEEFCQSWLELQCELIGGVKDAVVVLQKPGVETFAPLAFWPEGKRDRSHLVEISERALREGRGMLEPRTAGPVSLAQRPAPFSDYQLAYPVRVEGKVRGVVALELSGRDEVQLQAGMRQLQWGAGWLEVLLRRYADPMEAARLRVKIMLQLVAAFLEQGEYRDAATALVTEIASRLGCDRVVLAALERGALHIEAVSHAAQFDRHANLLGATIAAMTESLDQREPVVYPLEQSRRLAVTLSHAQLAQASGAGGVATFPLVHGGRQVGALTLERAAGFAFDAPTLELLEGLAAMLAPLVDLRRTRDRGLAAHAADAGRELATRVAGPGHAGTKLGLLLIAALALFLTVSTGTYRVSADARIEGEVQRAITAPFQAYVREAAVRAGDTVRQGQVLARLDDRDLKVERARLFAQREQLGQQYRDAMSRQERSQVRITSAQIAQSDAQLALLEEQLARTEVTAPFDGVVVSGDLSQALGAPIERGQVMWELAPLDAYRVILQVDERDIADLRVGQKGELVLSSMPGQHQALSVAKITPVSTPKEGRNVFRVEAQIDARGKAGGDSRLRPGMEGVAKVEVEERRLISIWTRRLTDWLALKSWSWLP